MTSRADNVAGNFRPDNRSSRGPSNRTRLLPIELHGGLQFVFGAGEIAFLHVEPAQAAVKLWILGSQRDGQLQGRDGVVGFLLAI